MGPQICDGMEKADLTPETGLIMRGRVDEIRDTGRWGMISDEIVARIVFWGAEVMAAFTYSCVFGPFRG